MMEKTRAEQSKVTSGCLMWVTADVINGNKEHNGKSLPWQNVIYARLLLPKVTSPNALGQVNKNDRGLIFPQVSHYEALPLAL